MRCPACHAVMDRKNNLAFHCGNCDRTYRLEEDGLVIDEDRPLDLPMEYTS